MVAPPGEYDCDVDRGDPRWVFVCLSDGMPNFLPKKHRELLLDIRHVPLTKGAPCATLGNRESAQTLRTGALGQNSY